MSKTISIVSLSLSVIALVLASLAYMRDDVISDATLNVAIDQALDRKEKSYIARLKPKIAQLLQDLDFKLAENEKDPQTLEDLFSPLVRMATSISQPQPEK